MCEILISNTTFMIAIAIFVLCILIGFLGDVHMRKSGKTGTFLKKQKLQENNENKNNDAIDENITNNAQTSNINTGGLTDFDSQAIFDNSTVQSQNKGAISNTDMQGNEISQNVGQISNMTSNQNMNAAQFQNGIQFQNNGVIQEQYYNAMSASANMAQNNSSFENNNQVQNVMQNQMPQNQGLNPGTVQIQNSVRQQNMNNFQYGTQPVNNNQTWANGQAGYTSQLFNNNSQNVNNPVPFDGNLQNDDQINNMF